MRVKQLPIDFMSVELTQREVGPCNPLQLRRTSRALNLPLGTTYDQGT